MTNDVGLMLCRDAQPTNMVGRPGFRHMVSRMDPRYTLPHPTTFARSIIPKLKETNTDFQRYLFLLVLLNAEEQKHLISGQ